MDMYERFTKITRKKTKKDYWETGGSDSQKYKNREDESRWSEQKEDIERDEETGRPDLRERSY